MRRPGARGWAAACGLALAVAAGQGAGADDRDLLRSSSADPYVFIVFDVSGSMNWTPQCTGESLAQGKCTAACPDGDCFAAFNSDDPSSKFYQAKEALYEVIQETGNIHFGFATYNQDDVRVAAKHWLYRKAAAQGSAPFVLGAGFRYPEDASVEVLGRTFDCDQGSDVGCFANTPADLGDGWERERIHRLPKGGADFDDSVTLYVRDPNGTRYRVIVAPDSGSLGADDIELSFRLDRCNNGSCSNRSYVGSRSYAYERVLPFADAADPRNAYSDFLSWDLAADRDVRQRGYFAQGEAADVSAGNTCSGWDPNDDENDDEYDNYSVKQPTVDDPLDPLMDRGDVLPLDWRTTNQQEILDRLAPNLLLGETVPDFRSARYFADGRGAGDVFLRLRNAAARPLLASGSTPLGNSVRDFRSWYAGCDHGNCPQDSGWKDLAAAQDDPDFSCRKKYLLVITDGDDTCAGPDACSSTAALYAQEGILTYVVAFGVQNTPGNRLNCMAHNGHTGTPYYADDQEKLVEALKKIFGEIDEQSAAFAAAAVPSAQADVADKSYLTSFVPLNSSSIWNGHLDAYLKPIPLHPVDQTPNRERDCTALGLSSSCHLWDAADSLLLQAPTPDDLAGGDLQIGPGALERRVYYAQASTAATVPRARRLFTPSAVTADRYDLWRGLGIAFVAGDLDSEAAAEVRAQAVIEETLVQKLGTISDPEGVEPDRDVTYVLGDIFHSDPVVVGNPSRFHYYAADLYGDGTPCVDGNPGYRCFADRHRLRRKLVVVGSNDGQVHAFDAGIYRGTFDGDEAIGTFDNGTGHELFSFLPRAALPAVRRFAEGGAQDYSVDARVLVDEFFIDPVHDGTPTVREWRTVAIGGLREGGSAYFALDLTQPDTLGLGDIPRPLLDGYVPSCHDGGAGCGELPYPAVLWELTDTWDEDANGHPDLGETWSNPNTGRIRLRDGDTVVERFVAVFGGGMDPDKLGRRGNWLYMVDIETGKPIYKRRLQGSAASEPAAVDTDHDSYLDTIYIGTTAGLMYKVDLSPVVALETVVVTDALTGATRNERRLVDAALEPFPIFDTGGRAIFYPPSVVFVARLNRYALAFGTGDREDLWSEVDVAGRFHLILDNGFTAQQYVDGVLPRTEASYAAIAVDAANEPGADHLLAPGENLDAGWTVALEPGERIITKAFALSGLLIFTSYLPERSAEEEGNGNNAEVTCVKSGQSRIYVLLTSNADAVVTADTVLTRYWRLPKFAGGLFFEPGQTQNRPNDEDPTTHSDQLTDDLRAILERLKTLFPENCKFGNFTLNIKTIRSDTGVFFIAPVPICVVEKNWKEF